VIGPPATVPLVMDGVPRELRAQPWIAWRWARAPGGGWRKAPFQIGLPDRKAANDRPEHWRNEGDVREVVALAPELFDGFGIVLTAAAGIAFIDLDHVIDPDTGAVAPWAMQMVTTFASFTEISCSGKGLHIFCRGQIPGGDGKWAPSTALWRTGSRCTASADTPISRAIRWGHRARWLSVSDS
jgi:primase-polymerase (primpol)-like protein